MLRFTFACGLSLACLASTSVAQVSLNVFDTFEDGTLMGWAGATRTNVLGGPGGPTDRYLQVDNGGTGGFVAAHNSGARWVGNYALAGATGVTGDFVNFGPQTLEIRLVLFGATPSGGGRWTSSSALVLPANSGWRTHTFFVAQGNLTSVFGAVPYTDMINNVTQVMFRHDPGTPSQGGAAGNGLLGMDNLRVVPAPGACGVLMLGVVGAMRRRR